MHCLTFWILREREHNEALCSDVDGMPRRPARHPCKESARPTEHPMSRILLGLEVRVIVLDPSDDAIAHVGVVSAHLTHRIDVYRTVIHCALGYVAINVFSVVAARLTPISTAL